MELVQMVGIVIFVIGTIGCIIAFIKEMFYRLENDLIE